MLPDTILSKLIGQTLSCMAAIISNIQARPDYSKNVKFADYVKKINEYRQNLLIAQAQKDLKPDTRQHLIRESTQDIEPILSNLINANVAMSKMGQLSTSRTIMPTMVLKHNKVMTEAQLVVDTLVAELYVADSGPPPPIKDAVLEGIIISGALKTPSGTHYQYYSKDQTVRLTAVTNPNEEGAWREVSWTGGVDSSSKLPNMRSIPLDAVSKQGQTSRVTATLKGKSLSVEITVVPNLVSLDISGALSNGDEVWTIIPSVTETSTVKAVTEPETADAHRFLQWEGGGVDHKHPDDRRLVTSADVAKKNNNYPITVKLKLH